MDIAEAKEFIYRDPTANYIIISKTLQPLIDRLPKKNFLHAFIYAVLDTPAGEKMFYIDWSYTGGPILMGVWIHKKFFMDWNRGATIIHIS